MCPENIRRKCERNWGVSEKSRVDQKKNVKSFLISPYYRVEGIESKQNMNDSSLNRRVIGEGLEMTSISPLPVNTTGSTV